MPSTNFRSSSSSSSSSSSDSHRTSRRTQTDIHLPPSTSTLRSSSVPPNQQFITILTNHPHMIQRTTDFRPRTRNQQGEQNSIPIQIHSGQPPSNQSTTMTENDYEDNLTDAIDELIRTFLNRPNRRSPYRSFFRWTFDDNESNLSYNVVFKIVESSRLTEMKELC